MKTLINGFKGIVGEIRKDAEAEVSVVRRDFELKKKELSLKFDADLKRELEKIERDAKKRAETEYARRISRCKMELQDALLSVKGGIVDEVRSLVVEKLSSLSASEKSSFVSKLVDKALNESGEEIVSVDVPKGVSLKLKNIDVNSSLSVLGAIIHTKSGAIIDRTLPTILAEKDRDLLRVISESW